MSKLNERDEAIEAVRRALCKLPRNSFFIDELDNVVRIPDKSGNWIDWQQAHELFDPILVDALVAKERARAAIAKATGNNHE